MPSLSGKILAVAARPYCLAQCIAYSLRALLFFGTFICFVLLESTLLLYDLLHVSFLSPSLLCRCRWHAIIVDGHDINALVKAFEEARATKGKPTCLVCKTYKGFAWDNAAEGINDLMGWHGKPLGGRADDVLAKIKAATNMEAFIPPPAPTKSLSAPDTGFIGMSSPPNYKPDEKVGIHGSVMSLSCYTDCAHRSAVYVMVFCCMYTQATVSDNILYSSVCCRLLLVWRMVLP